MTELFEKVFETNPGEPGLYITNLGELQFDGETFIMSGHKRRTPTVVDWWMRAASTAGTKAPERELLQHSDVA